MSHRILPLCALFLLFFHSLPCARQDRDIRKTGEEFFESPENLVLVIICAIRCDEAFEDSAHQYIPHMWNDLKPLGAICANLFSTCLTSTTSGHYAIVTGTRNNHSVSYQSFHPSFRPRLPTLYEYARREMGLTQNEVWMVTSKRHIYTMDHSTHPYGGSGWGAIPLRLDQASDQRTANVVAQLIDAYHPRFLTVTFGGVDRVAHTGDWEGYTDAIRAVDELVYLLWQDLESDPFYEGKTVLIVTGDHGRYDDLSSGFSSHGGTDHGSEHVLFLALGPGIRVNHVVERRVSLIDIAPTIGRLMGFDLPYAEGDVIEELLEDGHGIAGSLRGTQPDPGRISLTPGRSLRPDILADSLGIHLVWTEEDTSSQRERWMIAHAVSTDDGATWSPVEYPLDFPGLDGTPKYATIALHADSPEISATGYVGKTDALARRKYGWTIMNRKQRQDGTWEPPVPLPGSPGVRLWTYTIIDRPGFSADGPHASIAFPVRWEYVYLYGNADGEPHYDLLASSDLGFLGMQPRYQFGARTETEGTTTHILVEVNHPESRLLYARLSGGGEPADTAFFLDGTDDASFTPALVASRGTLHAAWAEYVEETWEIRYASIPSDGRDIRAISHAPMGTGGAINPAIAASGDTLIIAWEDYRIHPPEIFARASTDGGTSWGEEMALTSTSGRSTHPALASRSGRFFLAWEEDQDGRWEIYFDEVTLP